jgi:hypothetical protein
MNAKAPGFPEDRTETHRKQNLSDQQVKAMELAGGVEGGMQAGSAGGQSGSDAEADRIAVTEGRSSR